MDNKKIVSVACWDGHLYVVLNDGGVWKAPAGSDWPGKDWIEVTALFYPVNANDDNAK